MTITRIVNGKELEFELNSSELYNAFIEQEHKWDVSDVDGYYGHILTNQQIDEIAWEMRRQRTKYDLDFFNALEEAVHILGYDDLEEAS